MNKNDLITLLQNILSKSVERLSKLEEAYVSKKPEPDKWSQKEILGHLVDSALNNHRRFLISLNQEHLVFEPYDQVKWVQLHDYQSQSWIALVHFWENINQLIISLVSSYPDEKFTKKYAHHNLHRIAWKTVALDREASVQYLFSDYISHMEHHLEQILQGYHPLLDQYEQ